MNINLQYGDIVFYDCIIKSHTTLEKNMFTHMGVALVDGGNKAVVPCKVDKYWADDTDANQYKVKLTPLNEYIFYYENVYSSDLKSYIRNNDEKYYSVNDIKLFCEKWGSTDTELKEIFNIDDDDDDSLTDVAMAHDYLWIDEQNVWVLKNNSLFSSKDKELMNILNFIKNGN